MKLTAESRAALGTARDWLELWYGTRHALSDADVIGDIERHYEGGWDQFLVDRRAVR